MAKINLNNYLDKIIDKKHKLGLIHGDLKQTNIIYIEKEVKIIDWEEYFQLAPELIDVFFYLYRLSYKFGPEIIINMYLDNINWLINPFNKDIDYKIKLSLIYFIYWIHYTHLRTDIDKKFKVLVSFCRLILKKF